MEREDSFEAIVAKAVYEVNPQSVARPQQLKIAPLALAPFIAALEALRQPKSHHLSHAAVGISSYGGSAASGQAVLVPAVRTRPAGESPRPSKKLGRGTVVSGMDAIVGATSSPRGATNTS